MLWDPHLPDGGRHRRPLRSGPVGRDVPGHQLCPRYLPGDPVLKGTLHADPNYNPAQSDRADVAVAVLDKPVKE